MCQDSSKLPPGLVIHRTQHVVIFRTMVYYNRRVQSKIRKGKRHILVKVQRKPGITFQESYPSEVTQDVLISAATSYGYICEVLSTRGAH